MRLVALVIVAPRVFEEKLVQLLLDNGVAGAAGFTVREAVGYGRELKFRTVTERIGGRIRQIEIRLTLPAEAVPSLVETLKSTLPDKDVTWQVAPVSASGTFG